MGKGRKQSRAIQEVIALSREDPRRALALQLLTSWKVTIELDEETDEEGGELAMALSQAYLEWERETKQRAEQQGLQQGSQQALLTAVLDAIETRFGSIPEALREQLLQIQDVDQLRSLHRQALLCDDLDQFQRQLDQ